MAIAPETVLRAGLRVTSWGMVWCRKWALEGSASRRQVAELMDALHEVPNMLQDWDGHDVDEIRLHLGCYNAGRWGGPDLKSMFDAELAAAVSMTES